MVGRLLGMKSYYLHKVTGRKVYVMTFSEQLSKYRKEAKMTQEELAEKILARYWRRKNIFLIFRI